jgi:iron complex outermembrane receptor protein
MLLPNLTAYVGFRQDWWESYDGYANQVGTEGYPITYDSRDDSAFSPKVAVVYEPFDKTLLKASVGKSFRPPTINELYRTTTSASGITRAGNPDLDPETSTSWDIGIDQKLWKGAQASVTYFDNYMDDLIYRKTITSTYSEYVNVGKAQIRGVEIEAEQRLENGIRFFANFTYTNAKVKENDAEPETEGKRLIDVPERMLNIGGEFEKGKFATSLVGRYVSKRYRDDENRDAVNKVYTSRDPYFVTDAKISYSFTKWATLSLSVDNVFDREYFDYYKTPGRSWFGELTMRF